MNKKSKKKKSKEQYYLIIDDNYVGSFDNLKETLDSVNPLNVAGEGSEFIVIKGHKLLTAIEVPDPKCYLVVKDDK